jgi:hypothetical protein
MAGLDPAIHLEKKMDTRVKPAYDTLFQRSERLHAMSG